jgi:transcriptional regulator with XRE-family HTH domain
MLSDPVGEVKMDGKSQIMAAVKSLRHALGDTQQGFAHRLGLAISTVVRYESTRPPKGRALEQLAQVAEQAGLDAEAGAFRNALVQELGLTITPHAVMEYTPAPELQPLSDTEEALVAAVLRVMRNAEYQPIREALMGLLRPAMRERKKT